MVLIGVKQGCYVGFDCRLTVGILLKFECKGTKKISYMQKMMSF